MPVEVSENPLPQPVSTKKLLLISCFTEDDKLEYVCFSISPRNTEDRLLMSKLALAK